MTVVADVHAKADFSSDPIGLVRLIARFHLHPELDLHSSWLPRDWPARHRQVARFGAAGRVVLADWLRPSLPQVPLRFDAPLTRLMLFDSASLRRLAFYCGLCAHASLMDQRGSVGRRLRRLAQRVDDDGREFVLDRTPRLTSLMMSNSSIEQRPAAAGRIVVNRGYRLLQRVVATQGDAVLQRLQRKLPRRVSRLPLPELTSTQLAQLSELILMCLIPERLVQWDWLF